MMYLTKSQMDKMDALFDAQELPDTFPEDMEYAFMDLLAPEMTLERYLAMPEQQVHGDFVRYIICGLILAKFT